jgi:hypothetical protein
MSLGRVATALEALRAGYEQLAACDLEALSRSELLGVLDELETLACRLPTQWHRGLAGLQAQSTARELGAKSWPDVLAIRWRLSRTEARRRLAEAAEPGPRRTLTGTPLAPALTATAAAQASGAITGAHVAAIRDTMGRLPAATPTSTNSDWPADPTTASSTTTPVGPPPSTPAAKSNGHHHHTSTPDKPASTTTTYPNDYSAHPTTKLSATPIPKNPPDQRHQTTTRRDAGLAHSRTGAAPELG